MSGHAARRLAALHHACGRGEPEAAAHRLDRSLPGAPPRSTDADRGDAARARRARAAGQGALHRLLELFGAAGDRGAGHGEPARARGLRLLPGRIQPAGARHRARTGAAAKARGMGSCPISRSPAASSPASTGAARRCRRARGWRQNQRHAAEFINERNWRIVERARSVRRARAAAPCSNSRSAGCWRDPVVASVIAGATTPEQIEQNVRAADWTLSAEDLAELDWIAALKR